jgi:hypothetical protein
MKNPNPRRPRGRATKETTVKKIISGGQTGVDRAALDVGLALGIQCGGWCPKGRRAEDGVIPAKYPLTENTSIDYPARTAMNVRESDGTLVITRGVPDRGTALTLRLAQKHRKPCFTVNLDKAPGPSQVRKWLKEGKIKIINVAGPRESSCPGISEQARQYLDEVFRVRTRS